MCVHGLVHGNRPTEPQLQVVITGWWCVAKKKEHTTYRGLHLPWRKKKGLKKKGKKKKGKKKKEVPRTGIELANFDWIV